MTLRWPLLMAIALFLLGCAANETAANRSAETPDPVDKEMAGQTPEDANTAIASGVPGTEIYLVDLAAILGGQRQFDVVNITKRPGYDNQPAFDLLGERIFYSSIRDGKQSDVYEFRLDTRNTRQLTNTPQSEFSPTPRAGGSFTTVRVEISGEQHLSLYNAAGEFEQVLRPDLPTVGYHAVLDGGLVGVFLVADPPSLALAETVGAASLDEPVTIAENIGRALHRIPNTGHLSYVQKHEDGRMTIMRLDPETREATAWADTFGEQEDVAYLVDGRAGAGDGRSLYRLRPDSNRWQRMADLSNFLPGDIGRIAVSRRDQYLAIVVAETEE